MISSAIPEREPDPEDPIRKGFGTLLKGLGWAAGFIGFGLMWAISYWRP